MPSKMKLPVITDDERRQVAETINMVDESRVRMNSYSDSERHDLEQRARASATAAATPRHVVQHGP